MPVSLEELRPHLQAFDFPRLFVEGLGWDHFQGESLALPIDGHEYALKPVAEKASFAVFECAPGPDGAIPVYPVRRKIEAQVVKRAFEHLIIFVDAARTQQIWQWVKRQAGKPAACREHRFHAGQTGQPLLQRLDGFIVTLEDEARGIGITDVVSLVGKAFDVEKITKRFYERFRTELTAFGNFIEGITAQGDRDWYASLMLNRMMFVYFVQKQGFLDSNADYLRTKLREVQSGYGEDLFQQFYREFLLKLFHQGLGQPVDQRNQELKDLLGEVPFLNGGLFDPHELERDNPDISIPDAAFERVFDFFDGYRWHLDERPYREDNEINPDVLGYIFEKYVNQKQMGAYYTKEDITGYIGRNTVIPFLFDAARKECPVAFGPDGGVWRLLWDDPDRYIYPAVGHGIAWNARQPEAPAPLDAPFDLPEDIAAGIDDVSKRGGWNAPATEDYALPTETWREVMARRARHKEVRAKLAAGEVQAINNLITLNLDIERFTNDVISQSEGPELLRAFWHALYGNQERSDTGISVLDPTCGSGAFLFAALNVLEPLYTACLERMRGFLDDAERSERKRSPEHLGDFRRILDQVEKHPSERYFILKSIVLNNLYGVDIMEEAVEICKLRLFLKLAAQLESYDQIEPLPDIDFNIRAGNTLVGFTSLDAVRQATTVTPGWQSRMLSEDEERVLALIEEKADGLDRLAGHFRDQQTTHGGEVTSAHKQELRDRLRSLDGELDRYLAREYGVDLNKTAAYNAWRASHQPFHWFVEFFGIMSKGGFDVVIGNPPYVATKTLTYSLGRHLSSRYPDIYAHILQKSMQIASTVGRCGMILPLSITFSRDFASLRDEVSQWGTSWLSSFDNIPAALFAGVSQRCTILLSSPIGHDTYATRLYRWRAQFRSSLMANVTYTRLQQDFDVGPQGFPRLSNCDGERLLSLHSQVTSEASSDSARSGTPPGNLGFSPTARNFISTYLEPPPTLEEDGTIIRDGSSGSSVTLATSGLALAGLAVTSGAACFWYWLTRGDGFHVTNALLSDYLAPLPVIGAECQQNLQVIGKLIHQRRNEALVFKKNAGKYVGNFNYQSLSPLTVRADLIYLAGIGASWVDVESLLSFAALVRALNEAAGEKNIPQRIKAPFSASKSPEAYVDKRLREIDEWLAQAFDVPIGRVLEANQV